MASNPAPNQNRWSGVSIPTRYASPESHFVKRLRHRRQKKCESGRRDAAACLRTPVGRLGQLCLTDCRSVQICPVWQHQPDASPCGPDRREPATTAPGGGLADGRGYRDEGIQRRNKRPGRPKSARGAAHVGDPASLINELRSQTSPAQSPNPLLRPSTLSAGHEVPLAPPPSPRVRRQEIRHLLLQHRPQCPARIHQATA